MLCGDVCRTDFFRDKCTHNGAPFLIFFQLFIAESRKKYQKKIKTAAFFETRRLPEQAGGKINLRKNRFTLQNRRNVERHIAERVSAAGMDPAERFIRFAAAVRLGGDKHLS